MSTAKFFVLMLGITGLLLNRVALNGNHIFLKGENLMRVNLPISVFVAVILTFSILASSVTTITVADFGDKINIYSDVPKWAKEQYGTKVIGLNVIAGAYKLSSGTTLKAGSQVFVLEEWMTFKPGLLIDVGKGGVTLKGISYPNGTKLIINKDKEIIQRSK